MCTGCGITPQKNGANVRKSRSRLRRIVEFTFAASLITVPAALITGALVLDGVPRNGGMSARHRAPQPVIDPDTPGGRFLARLDRDGVAVPGHTDREKIAVGESVCTSLNSIPGSDYGTVLTATEDATKDTAAARQLIDAAVTELCPV